MNMTNHFCDNYIKNETTKSSGNNEWIGELQVARKEGMKVDEDKQPRRRRGGSWEEARVGLLPITGLSQV